MAFSNQSHVDRAIHLLVGLAMLALGWILADGLFATSLRLFGWVPLVEGALGWSPFYALLGIDTRQAGRSERRNGAESEPR